jgi:hypothetical protein
MRTAAAALGGVVTGLLIAAGFVVARDDDPAGRGAPEAAADVATTAPPPADRSGDVLVFLDQGVSDEDRRGIEAVLDADPRVAGYEYWDNAESVEEARRLFSRNAEMLAKIEREPELIPSSYRLTVIDGDWQAAGRLAAELEDLPGVRETAVDASNLNWEAEPV